jgi:hypothetical protein
MPKVLLPVLVAGFCLTTPVQAQDQARALIDQAIKAHGGADQLVKARAVWDRHRGTIYLMDGTILSFTAESTVQLPGQFKNVIQTEFKTTKVTLVQVLNGDAGWQSINGETRPVDEATLAGWKEMIYTGNIASLLPLLKDESYQLGLAGEVKVNDRPAASVKVSSPGHRDVYLFFDKANGLLIKRQYHTVDPATQKEVIHEEFSSDFHQVEGILRPLKVVVHQNGRKYLEGELQEVKILGRVEDSVFSKP